MKTEEERLKQRAKNKKIAEVQKAGVYALISSLLEGMVDSSVEILSGTKSSTVILLRIGKNTGVFKLGAEYLKWLPKIKKVIEAFADFTNSGEGIFGVIKEQKLRLAEISAKKAVYMTLKADSDGSMNLFIAGVLRKMNYHGVKNLALFDISKIDKKTFCDCKSLSSVVIPEGVTEIGAESFNGCKSLTSMSIPSSIKSIGDGAFKWCGLLSSVVIPNSVTEIGAEAFYGCKSLTSVSIPSSVKKIGEYAFNDCKSLTSVSIPSSVNKIGDYAFNDCKSLTTVELPSSITTIGSSAFHGCVSISLVNFVGTMAQWDAVEGKKRNLLRYIPANSVKCVDGEWQKPVLLVEDGVALGYLDECATSVVIPDGVKKIGEYAFSGCKSLLSVVIPCSVTEIGGGAFAWCKSLSSVIIPPNVTEIGGYAFNGCNINSLEHPCLTIKNGVAIKDNVVLYCASQSSSITIPEGVIVIGYEAFYCSSLSSVVISSGVTSICSSAFYNCKSLVSVVISSSVRIIGRYAFNGCKSLSSVVIPCNVTEIGDGAFLGCKSLSSVVIPYSIMAIGWYAFKGCTSLSSVEFGGTVAEWDAVKKGDNWNFGVPAECVKCADGEVAI